MQTHLLLYRNSYAEKYLSFWLILFFVTSVVVFPAVKGTTPAYLLALASFPFALSLSRYKSQVYLTRLCIALLLVFILSFLSQFVVWLSQDRFPPEEDLIFISNETSFLLRSSFFTQHLYLFVGLLAFAFVYVYYQEEKHDRYMYAGALLLVAYGCYEELYFLATGTYGDVLSNRVFGEDGSGSLLQSITIAGLTLQRFKSLTGEPSMYAFSIFPVFIFAYFYGKKPMIYVLLFSLALTFSTTFFLGLFVLLTGRFFQRGIRDRLVFFTLLAAVVVVIFFLPTLLELFDEMVWQKLKATNLSGMQRTEFFANHMRFFIGLPLEAQLTGIGFGVVRSTDFFSTLLVNNGIIGFIVFTSFFLYPALKLKKGVRQSALRYSVVFLYLSMMIAVPEFSYLAVWLFLGLAYNQLLLDKVNYAQ